MVGLASKTRIFFVTDIHGSDRLFFKFVNAGKVYESNVLILGGDITGKTITPIFKEDGISKAMIGGQWKTATTTSELEDLKGQIRNYGSYPHETSKEEWDSMTANHEKMDSLFKELITESVGKWIQIAEERLKPLGVNILINIGNDDFNEIGELISKSHYVIYPQGKVVDIDGKHEVVSVGNSNLTPWQCPGDITEEELGNKLEQALTQVRDMKNCIFNTHCPPVDTHIDLAPKLDKDLKPILTPGGEPEMTHVGSASIRAAIEKHQPLLGLHGHIHEARGFVKIGRTICFNPGSEYATGVLRGVVVNLSDKGIDNYIMTEG